MTSAFVGRKSESNDFASFLESESQLGSNILILYGASGAGKTEFSRNLRAWSSKNPLKHWEECPPILKKRSTVMRVLDFGFLDVPPAEMLLRTIYAAIPRKIKHPTFTEGFAKYVAKGGTPKNLDTQAKSLFREQADLAKVFDKLFEAIDRIVPLNLIASIGNLLKNGVLKIKLRHCEVYRDYLENLDEALLLKGCLTDEDAKGLGGLLKWDLGKSGRPLPPVIVFIDGFDQYKEVLEICVTLPEILFVVNMQGTPNAVPGHFCRTVELGELGLEDAKAWFDARCAGEQNGCSQEDLRKFLHNFEAEKQLPVRLEGIFKEIKADDQQAAEQQIKDLNLLALLRRFDDTICREVTGKAIETIKKLDPELLSAPNNNYQTNLLPYRIVGTKKLELLNHLDDPEQKILANKLLDHIHTVVKKCTNSDLQSAYARIALQICLDLDIEADWIRVELFKLPSLPHTATLFPETQDATWAGYLTLFIRIWNEPNVHRSESLKLFSEIIDLPESLKVASLRSYAYSIRSFEGDHGEALRVFKLLLKDHQQFAKEIHLHQLAFTYFEMNNFVKGSETATILSNEPDSESKSTKLAQLNALSWRAHGKLKEASINFTERGEYLLSQRDQRNGLEAIRLAAMMLVLNSEFSEELLADVQSQLDFTHDDPRTRRQILAIIALSCPRNVDRISAINQEQLNIGQPHGLDEFAPYVLLPLTFSAAVRGDVKCLEQVIESWKKAQRNMPSFWLRIAEFWLDEIKDDGQITKGLDVIWTENEDDVRARWVEVLKKAQARTIV